MFHLFILITKYLIKDLVARSGLEKSVLLVPVRNPGLIEMITVGFPRYPQPLQVSRISVHDLGARLDGCRVTVQSPVHVERAGDTGARARRIHGSRMSLRKSPRSLLQILTYYRVLSKITSQISLM